MGVRDLGGTGMQMRGEETLREVLSQRRGTLGWDTHCSLRGSGDWRVVGADDLGFFSLFPLF